MGFNHQSMGGGSLSCFKDRSRSRFVLKKARSPGLSSSSVTDSGNTSFQWYGATFGTTHPDESSELF